MIRGRLLRATAVPVLALNLLGACYRYVPVTTSDLVIGAAYRGHLSAEGSQTIARLLGENVTRFDGRIVTVTDTAVLVAMSATLKRTEQRQTVWTGEQLLIPRAVVSRFELRQLDRPRTMRAVALYAVGIGLLGAIVLSISGFASQDGNPPPPPPPP
jgi:hypothetical protein